MEKDKIFFGEGGITTTSANYIANLAKEGYQNLEAELDNMQLYTTEVGLLGSSSTNTLKEGVSISFIKDIPSKLECITQLKSLIAWLREAIKAKDRLIKEAINLDGKDVVKFLGLEMPVSPEGYTRLTSDDVVASWNIKQRNRYYYLDTACAVIGSQIHPSGHFSSCRKRLSEILGEKHTVNGSGRDMVIYTRTPTVSQAEVEEAFFSLQNKYREYQAELNSLKHSIEVALQEDEREKSLKETEEYEKYSTEYSKVMQQVRMYKNQAVADAQALKIIIPDSLKSIYKMVSERGKKK